MATKNEPLPEKTYSAREFIREGIDGHTTSSVSQGSGVPYSTLAPYVAEGSTRKMSVKNAKILEVWSEGRISAAKTLGLES